MHKWFKMTLAHYKVFTIRTDGLKCNFLDATSFFSRLRSEVGLRFILTNREFLLFIYFFGLVVGLVGS